MSQQPSQPQAESGYGLPEIFAALRADFVAAQAALSDADRKPMMEVTEAEIELRFTLERETKGGGGLNLKFFGAGFEGRGEVGRSAGTSHRLTVRLSPVPGRDLGVLGPPPPRE